MELKDKHWITALAAHHKEWVAIVRLFGTDNPEDIVQECYIKLMKIGDPDKYFENGEINRALMWVTLRNMFFTINKKEATQLIPYEAVQNIIRTQENTERLDALERIELKIKSEMQTWEEYDRQLFILYRNSGFSMRKIEAEVGIGLRSVWQTINNCKKRLNEAIGEDWQDYINEDFELI